MMRTHMLSRLRESLASQLPTPQQLAQQRWLGPLAHRLGERGLWHARPQALARGAAIGLFWAFVVPFAQVLFAAAHCVWWRANIPLAAAITFITNPFTVGGWLWLAYQVGSWIVPGQPAAVADGPWLDRLQALGTPTLLGMGVFAVGGALLGYVAVLLGAKLWRRWRLAQLRKRT
jgi:hypothetical protein